MKKTLLLTLEYPPQRGGIASYLQGLVDQLPHDHIVVLADRFKNSFLFDRKQNYSILRAPLLSSWLWPRWIAAIFRARAVIRQEKIEQIIISHVLPMGYVALALGVPFITICHGMDVLMAQRSEVKKYFLKKILKKSSHCIANSEFTKGIISALGIPADKITVAYPCPEAPATPTPEVRAAVAAELGTGPVLLTVGRLVERKGVDSVIAILSALREQFPTLRYVVAGDGPYTGSLHVLAKKNNVKDMIIWKSQATDDERAALYSLAHLFVMPVRTPRPEDVEGFGLVYLEANSYGVPVVAGKSGGVPEAVRDGETGVLVDPANPHDLYRAVASLLSDPQRVREMGAAGQAWASKFTWKNEIEKIRPVL